MDILYRLKNMKIKRAIRHFFQRIFRGFDDSETYNLEATLARHIVPRLKRFKELNNGYPPDLAFESWNIIINEMIYALEFRAKETVDQLDATVEEYDRVQRGLAAFGRHFSELWW